MRMGTESQPVPALTAGEAARFWSKVRRGAENECWEWQAGRSPRGYGKFGIVRREPDRKVIHLRANRIAYALAVAPVGAGEVICHRCDNPPCCNPAHHFAGTDADNAADRKSKGGYATGGEHWSRQAPERRARGDARGGGR